MATTIVPLDPTKPLYPDNTNNVNNSLASLNTNKLESGNNLSDVASKASSLNNLLPSQTGASGKLLTTDGAGTTSWVNPTSIPDASSTVKGETKLSLAPVSGTNPIAVGDNDTRVPTQDENNALVGLSGTAPSTSNPLVDKAAFTIEQGLTEHLTNKDTTTTLGTSDTKYPSQNAVKTYVDNAITNNVGVGLSAAGSHKVAGFAGTWVNNNFGTSPTLGATIISGLSGLLNFSFKAHTGGVGTLNVQIYKNGVAIGTQHSTSSGTDVTFTDSSLSFNYGDSIQIYCWVNSGTSQIVVDTLVISNNSWVGAD